MYVKEKNQSFLINLTLLKFGCEHELKNAVRIQRLFETYDAQFSSSKSYAKKGDDKTRK